MQRNWIGKSTGLEFEFELSSSSKEKLGGNFEKYKVFTTRPDTIYGVTYSALAPEHEIVKYLIKNRLLSDEKIATIEAMQKLTQRDRDTQEKAGLDLEITVIHPYKRGSSCLGR